MVRAEHRISGGDLGQAVADGEGAAEPGTWRFRRGSN